MPVWLHPVRSGRIGNWTPIWSGRDPLALLPDGLGTSWMLLLAAEAANEEGACEIVGQIWLSLPGSA